MLATPPVDSRAVRERLVEALRLDLVGPWAGHELDAEQLPGRERPSNWYVAGCLIPTGTPPERSGDADEDDDLDAVSESAGLAEESNDERRVARKAFFPSSIGLSFLVPAGCRGLAVTVRWGDYAPGEIEEAGGGKTPVWRRTAHEAALSVPLGGDAGPVVRDVQGSGGLQLHVVERPIGAMGTDGAALPAGTRSGSCFLVNRRTPDEAQPDCAYAFQAEIEVRADEGFVPRPDLRGAHAAEWDDQVADLHYADTPEYATGHGVSAEWDLDDGGAGLSAPLGSARPRWRRRRRRMFPGSSCRWRSWGAWTMAGRRRGRSTHSSSSIGAGSRRAGARWRAVPCRVRGGRRPSSCSTTRRWRPTAMASGVARLGEDADLLDAFRVANRAVARALRQRLGDQIGPDGPRWRPFQLAFLLLNLPGLADPRDPHRETVDLLFFPTGGGKTEAYLGLAAVAMVLRRLRHPGDDGLAGASVSLIMRYTLRLLTLDQLARAAGLVCALEMERGGRAVRRVAVRDRPLGGEGGHAERPGPEGRRPPRLGAGEGDQVQAEPRPQPVADPARELPLVRAGVRAGVDPLRILLATDAAREGLNFQAHCADLFHFDLPWNPGRIEQRNGRIDRKLQPAAEVRCHYFGLPQRVEDRVLDVLVRKTETIKRELGSLSKVIDDDVERRLRGGIRHHDADRLKRAIETADLDEIRRQITEEELEVARDRRDDLTEQVERCRGLLVRSRTWVGFEADPFRDALSCALELLGAEPLARNGGGNGGGQKQATWTFPALDRRTGADPTWAATLDTLRPPRRRDQKLADWRREAPIRPVVFEATTPSTCT